MQITRIEAIPVRIKTRTPFASALGTRTVAEHAVVIVEVENGLRGIGEISLIWHGNGAGLCNDVNRILAPALMGLDPFQLSRFHSIASKCFEFGYHSLTAVAAVEMALLDIQGKAVGQPVYNLLGGLMRDRVELSMSIPMGTVEEGLAYARRYVDQGLNCVKVKAGHDIEHDVELVRRLRQEFSPALQIRVDANMAWRQPKEALAAIRAMTRYDILSVEQPLSPADLAGLAFLQQHADVPIIVDESVWSPVDAWRVIQAGAADLVNIYVAEAGGLAPARLIADLASLAGVGVCIGSMSEFGIGTAAAAHLAVSLPYLDHPSDVAGYLYHADDVVVTSPPIENGYALPPRGPGLGVELDEDKLSRFRSDQTEGVPQ
jgi:muconate cycloisomerase